MEGIKESRVKEIMPPNINATFITLIPKKDKPESYDDFHPISLCNMVYNTITKTLSNRVKMVLEVLSTEEFGFLYSM